MEITLQYFDGCPNWKTTAADLAELVARHHIDTSVEHQLIDTPDAAEKHGFRGSPTVLVNGVDPFADADAPVGLSCRVYVTPEGLAGSPTRDQLLEALQATEA